MNVKYVHTNLIAEDWKKLSKFYCDVLECEPVLPERELRGAWLEKATSIGNAEISGMHLRLPGYGDAGPTLEIFQYNRVPFHQPVQINTPGYSHIAFSVDDVQKTAEMIFKHGGKPVGEVTVREIGGVGKLIFQYVSDPEGNILEIQKWEKG